MRKPSPSHRGSLHAFCTALRHALRGSALLAGLESKGTVKRFADPLPEGAPSSACQQCEAPGSNGSLVDVSTRV